VALLLAVWSFVETPFCGVDEFDVFMDPVARALALRYLVEGAVAMQPYRQFLFLTPLDRAYVRFVVFESVGPLLISFAFQGNSAGCATTRGTSCGGRCCCW
jgi:hypothetical protein